MAEYELSKKADEDLNDIYRFSSRRFGAAAADTDLLALERRFSILAAQPGLGRRIDGIRSGYFRYEHASHSIFYHLSGNGIIVMRVLHRSMDIGRHIR
jgi:toxin ParE1/3/4